MIRRRRSVFAADVLPDGTRRYGHRAVVARRTLLTVVTVAGVAGGLLVRRRGADPALPAAADPAVQDPVVAVAAAAPTATPAAPEHSTSQADSPWVIVNKQHPIDPLDYAPALAVVGGREVAAVIAPDLRALLDAAGADGVALSVTSGFRSLQRQRAVHDGAVAREGLEVAESVSARPGYSEHQTGLAVDFGGRTEPGCLLENCFGLTPEAQWLQANGSRFGFVLRYPDGRTEVTGYAPEPWHWRWVGTELVGRMASVGAPTLEEFFGVSGGTTYA